MIEPAQQNRVRIDERLGTKVRRPNSIPPRNVHPRSSKKVLMFARKIAARGFAQREKTIYAAPEKHVIPARNVQRRNTNFVETLANVERSPIIAGRIVIEPVEYVRRQAFAAQGRIPANG